MCSFFILNVSVTHHIASSQSPLFVKLCAPDNVIIIFAILKLGVLYRLLITKFNFILKYNFVLSAINIYHFVLLSFCFIIVFYCF